MDCRNHSMEFAREAAGVCVANGVSVRIFDSLRPTPELSFAVREYGCIAGINVTASHNPKEYNGYKVYWEDGAQLPPHHAAAVAKKMEEIDIFGGVKTMAFVELEHRGDIAVLTINRPEALNALNDEVISQLDKALDSVDPAAIRCLIVTGAGQKAFVAGADIAQMSELTKAEGEAFGKHGNDVFRKLETLPVPTIAVVNGFALGGGCELSMAGFTARKIFGKRVFSLGTTIPEALINQPKQVLSN